MFLAFVFGVIAGHLATVFLFVVAKSHTSSIVSYVNTTTQTANKLLPQRRGFVIDGEQDVAEERREAILSKNASRGTVTFLKDL